MYDLAIKGGICLVDKEFTAANVGVNGNKIVYVGREDIAGEIEIYASGCFILPGLFNAHTHAAMTALRGYAENMPLKDWLENVWRMEANLKCKDVYWGSILACVEMIKTGTTCFADMYIFMDEVAKAVGESGIRAILGYGMADRGDAERAKKELEVGLKFIKDWDGTFEGRIRCILTPHAPYTCSKEFLLKIKEVSPGLVKHIHVSETKWEVEEIKKTYGLTPVRFLDSIGFLDEKTVVAHAVWLDDEEIKILAERKVSVAHCPASNLKLSSGIARVAEMLEQGVNVCIGTDGAASNNMLNMFAEIRLASLLQLYRQKYISGQQYLKMATENGYRAYGLRGGRIEKGYLADIIVVSKSYSHIPVYNPFHSILFASKGCEVKHVIVNGELVMEDRAILTLDEERVLEKVEEIAERLAS